MKKILLAIAAIALSFVAAFAQNAPRVDPYAREAELFPDGLIRPGEDAKKAAKTHFKDLKGKFIGVYYSASWCGPCRSFSPHLVEFSKKNKKNFVVVFSSADKTEDAMKDYANHYKMAKAKWLALPFRGKTTAPGPGGYPTLVVIAPDGSVFTKIVGAQPKLLDDIAKKMADWKKNPPKK